MIATVSRMGKRGTVVLPAELRRRFGMEEGALLLAEGREDGILLRPAAVVPMETYSPARKAEFLLNNAVTLGDYRQAVLDVRELGLDPAAIKHRKPKGTART